MIKEIWSRFARQKLENSRAERAEALQMAAVSLLVEAAQIDGHFDDAERLAIVNLAQRYFGLSPEAAEQLTARAKQNADQAVDVFGFTQMLMTGFDEEERRLLLEMLWEVVYADNHLDQYQAALMRRVTGLLGLQDRDSAQARQKVLGNRNLS